VTRLSATSDGCSGISILVVGNAITLKDRENAKCPKNFWAGSVPGQRGASRVALSAPGPWRPRPPCAPISIPVNSFAITLKERENAKCPKNFAPSCPIADKPVASEPHPAVGPRATSADTGGRISILLGRAINS
jgi:hypothetical protein